MLFSETCLFLDRCSLLAVLLGYSLLQLYSKELANVLGGPIIYLLSSRSLRSDRHSPVT